MVPKARVIVVILVVSNCYRRDAKWAWDSGVANPGEFDPGTAEYGAARNYLPIWVVWITCKMGDDGTEYKARLNVVDNKVIVVEVRDTADPAQLSVVSTLDIPGTVQLSDVAVDGHYALVVGNTGPAAM